MSMLAAACVMGVASSLSVGVIGAGPGGLALAVALEQKMGERVSVTVFDRSDQLRPALGGGVQLNSGAAVLSRLGLGDEVLKVGNPVKRVLSRNVKQEELLSLDIQQALRSSEAATEAGVVQNGKVYAVTMMRDALQGILASRLRSTTLELDCELSDVKLVGEQARCSFADGSTRDFDVVVGADGLGSKVRKCISPEEAVYDTKIKIQWAVAPSGSRSVEEELHQWFAPDGVYCLASTYGGLDGKLYDQVVLVSPSEDNNKINDRWDGSSPEALEAERARLCGELEKAGMPSELVAIATKSERIFRLTSHGLNPLLPWTGLKGRCVLIGDAAHAMPPFLGQGTNQAIQDAYCLATELAKLTDKQPRTAVWAYELKRKLPTSKLAASSRILGLVETSFPQFARDAFFRTTAATGIAKFVFLDGAVPTV